MPRKKLIQLALAAMVVAAVISLAAFRALRSRLGGGEPAAAVRVVALAEDVAAGVEIKRSNLRLLQLPSAALPAHVFSSVDQVAGHMLATAASANQIVTAGMMAEAGAGVGLPPKIPPGMRAVSVKVNDVVSVAGYAVPGTHVDVLVTGNPHQDNNPATMTTTTVLSNVQVLTAGQQMEQSPEGKPDTVTVITLLVDPAGAQKLALANSEGKIQLTLRNPLDNGTPLSAPLLNMELYGAAGPGPASAPAPRRAAAPATVAAPNVKVPVVAAAPVAAWAVEVISGGDHKTISFSASQLGERSHP